MIKTTLSLPPHQEKGFKEILAGISHTQKRIGVHKWNRVLGELRSMATPYLDPEASLATCKSPYVTFKGKVCTK